MKRILIVAILVQILSFTTFSQNFHLPLEYKSAYKNMTRSADGRPGINYWQNSSNYDIDAKIIPQTSMLEAEENIKYFNNSPDTLRKIVMRLYQNFFKLGNARGWSIGNVDLGDGMVLDSVKIDRGIKNTFTTATNIVFVLNEGINPGDSAEIYVKWNFHIAEKRRVRMGNYGNNRFFLAYWYPQIAVYDDIDGWDMNEYFGATEFYNDFNNYNVKIKLPSEFMAWATGDLQDADKHWSKQVLKRIESVYESDELVKLITPEDKENNNVFAKKASNVWQFNAEYVPDFSFAAVKDYNWDAKSVVVDSASMRKVFADAIYPDDPQTFQEGAKWAAKSLEIMSFQLPGVAFPYEHMTSFSNGTPNGGMETPMMANDGDPKTIASLAGLLFHENSHSYFPFFMGTNERKYAWMDEGWAAYLTHQMMDVIDTNNNYIERSVRRFESISGSEKEVGLMNLTSNITDYNAYRVHSYNKPALAYHFLRDALGDSIFKQALHSYMYLWQGRHPSPYDFFASMATASGTKLYWFIKPWFFDKAYADLGIKKLTNDNKIVVENYGGLPLPVQLTITYEDGSKDEVYKNASVWASGDNAVIIPANAEKKIKAIHLGSKTIPDVNEENNLFEALTTDN